MSKNQLDVSNLKLSIQDRMVLRGINLKIRRGEFHVLFGPNGTGKSTLLRTIMGLYNGSVIEGEIVFEGKNITFLPVYERARMGLSLMFQYPPSFDGLKVADVVKALQDKFGYPDIPINLDITRFVNRDLFKNFSGGEKKIVELYLSTIQKPKLLMLDEPDSGVDIENIRQIGKHIHNLIRQGVSILLVTHHGFILDYIDIQPDFAHIMIDGSIVLSGRPDQIIDVILKHGYKKGIEILLGVE